MATNLDASSIDAFRDGDEKIYNQIVGFYRLWLYNYCRNRLQEEEDAKDVVTDTLVALWAVREKINDAGHIKNYLFTTARGKCNKLLNRAKFIDTIDLDEIADTATDYESLKAAALHQIQLDAFDGEIQSLSEEHRIALTLRLRKMPVEEIAAVLGVDYRKVTNLCARAITLIKEGLKKKGLIDILLFIAFSGYF